MNQKKFLVFIKKNNKSHLVKKYSNPKFRKLCIGFSEFLKSWTRIKGYVVKKANFTLLKFPKVGSFEFSKQRASVRKYLKVFYFKALTSFYTSQVSFCFNTKSIIHSVDGQLTLKCSKREIQLFLEIRFKSLQLVATPHYEEIQNTINSQDTLVKKVNQEVINTKLLKRVSDKTFSLLQNYENPDKKQLRRWAACPKKNVFCKSPKITGVLDSEILYRFVVEPTLFKVFSDLLEYRKRGLKPYVRVHVVIRELVTTLRQVEYHKLDHPTGSTLSFHENSYKKFIKFFCEHIAGEGLKVVSQKKVKGTIKFSVKLLYPGLFVNKLPYLVKNTFPILCKPKDWVYDDRLLDGVAGGYLLSDSYTNLQNSFKNRRQLLIIKANEGANYDGLPILKSVNYLQSIPKRYSYSVFTNIIECRGYILFFNQDSFAKLFGYLPSGKESFFSFCSKLYSQYQARLVTGGILIKDLDEDACIDAAVNEAVVYIEKFKASIDLLFIIKSFGSCVTFKRKGFKYKKFLPVYDVYKIDFRGRLYPTGYFNASTSKLVRYALRFYDNSDSYAFGAQGGDGIREEFRDNRISSRKELRLLYRYLGFIMACCIYGSENVKSIEHSYEKIRTDFYGRADTTNRERGPSNARIYGTLKDLTISRIVRNEISIKNPGKLASIHSDFQIDLIPTVEFDATCSGIQIIAIACGDLKFIKLTNVISSKDHRLNLQVEDVYKYIGSTLSKSCTLSSLKLKNKGWGHEDFVFLYRICNSRKLVKKVLIPVLFGAGIDGVEKALASEPTLIGCHIRKLASFFVYNIKYKILKNLFERINDLCDIEKKLQKGSFDQPRASGEYPEAFFINHSPIGSTNCSYYRVVRDVCFRTKDEQGILVRRRPRHFPFKIGPDSNKPSLDLQMSYQRFLPNVTHQIDAFVIHKVISRFMELQLPLHTVHDAFIVRLDHYRDLKEAYIEALIELNAYYSSWSKEHGKKGFHELTEKEKFYIKYSKYFLIP